MYFAISFQRYDQSCSRTYLSVTEDELPVALAMMKEWRSYRSCISLDYQKCLDTPSSAFTLQEIEIISHKMGRL